MSEDTDTSELFSDYVSEDVKKSGDEREMPENDTDKACDTSEKANNVPDSKKLADIKDTCLRTDLSALAKIDKILNLIDPSFNKNKRPADCDMNSGDKPKQAKHDDAEESEEPNETFLGIDSCVVCGLTLKVFKEDQMKEFQHYMR